MAVEAGEEKKEKIEPSPLIVKEDNQVGRWQTNNSSKENDDGGAEEIGIIQAFVPVPIR